MAARVAAHLSVLHCGLWRLPSALWIDDSTWPECPLACLCIESRRVVSWYCVDINRLLCELSSCIEAIRLSRTAHLFLVKSAALVHCVGCVQKFDQCAHRVEVMVWVTQIVRKSHQVEPCLLKDIRRYNHLSRTNIFNFWPYRVRLYSVLAWVFCGLSLKVPLTHRPCHPPTVN